MDKNSFFNQCFWEKWLYACRRLKLVPCLSPYTSINSKWIKDLNIRHKILLLTHKRAGNTLETIGLGKDILSKVPVAHRLREKIDKWEYMKLKSSGQQKKWSLH
jgi:hypothetical protein